MASSDPASRAKAHRDTIYRVIEYASAHHRRLFDYDLEQLFESLLDSFDVYLKHEPPLSQIDFSIEDDALGRNLLIAKIGAFTAFSNEVARIAERDKLQQLEPLIAKLNKQLGDLYVSFFPYQSVRL